MAKLTEKLTTKQFVLSQLVILVLGLVFLGGLYYILNIQYSLPKDRFLAGPVTTAPRTLRVDLDEPDDNALVFTSRINVSGTTSPNLDVLVTTGSADVVVSSDAKGKFSTSTTLDEGPSKIRVVVFDATGESRTAERNVYYSREKI